MGHDECTHASTHELIRTMQQLSPIQAGDSNSDRPEQPAPPNDTGSKNTAAANGNGQAGLSLPNTPSEPSLNAQPGPATPILGVAQHPECRGQTGSRDESVAISSLMAGAMAAAAAQPGIAFELRVRGYLRVFVTTAFTVLLLHR